MKNRILGASVLLGGLGLSATGQAHPGHSHEGAGIFHEVITGLAPLLLVGLVVILGIALKKRTRPSQDGR